MAQLMESWLHGVPWRLEAGADQLWRRQQLDALLGEFPTYQAVGTSSTERGHVVALAQALRGMDAALSYAQQAENEANAPRLTVAFHSFDLNPRANQRHWPCQSI